MKMPNGYGGITKLSGKRRRPWRVRVTDGWDKSDINNPKQKYINVGYFETRAEAMKALAKYHSELTAFTDKPTFAQIFDLWSADAFKKGSKSRQYSYMAAFKMALPLHNKKISAVTLSDMQMIINNSDNKFQSKNNFKILCSALFDYAIANKYLPPSSNYCSSLDVGEIHKPDIHYIFTSDEIAELWKHTDDDTIKIILMLIYSGCRPSELLTLNKSDINTDEHYFTIKKGKTKNAARIVPIADKTYPFFIYYMNKNSDGSALFKNSENTKTPLHSFRTEFCSALQKHNLYHYTKPETGETKDHLPDDTRHTFTSMWTSAELNETARRFIQGHSRSGTGEQYYTHLTPEKLLEYVNKL